MIPSRHQNLLQNQNTVIGNLAFENVEKFRYLGVTVTNTNDIKRRINMGNSCHYSLEKILSFRLLSKKLRVNIYKTIRPIGLLPLVLYGCETWSLTLREE